MANLETATRFVNSKGRDFMAPFAPGSNSDYSNADREVMDAQLKWVARCTTPAMA